MALSVDIAMPALTIDDITIGHTLHGNNSTYTVQEFLGQGVFGKVAKCLNVQTDELVAIKILKDPNAIKEAEKEVSMLEALRVLDSDAYNVVKFFGRFEYRGLTCLAFEMLEMNVFDLIQSREWEPLAPCDIRPIAKQLLVTLDGLKGLGVIHTDLKLDNIMLPKVKEQPFRVKVIDFGEARYSSEVRAGMWAQPCGSRSPEVSLGNKFNESIDVFSLGCNLVFLYLGYFLFPIDCNYQMVKRMVEILGYPPDYLLLNGVYTRLYFKEVVDEESWSTTWTLRTPEEYEQVAKTKTEEYDGYGCELKSLDDLVDAYPKWEDEEYEDRKALVDLLKGLLNPDPCLRLSPKQALQHHFITMSHLQNTDSTKYFEQSQQAMQVCPDVPFEDIVMVSEEGSTTIDLPKDYLAPPESSDLDDWCESCAPETLSATNQFDEVEAPDSSDWLYEAQDQSFDNQSWCEENDAFYSTGLDIERSPDIWSLEDERSDGPAHFAQFEDWLSDADSRGFPDIDIKTTSYAWSQNATRTNGSEQYGQLSASNSSLSGLDMFSDEHICMSDGKVETDRSSKAAPLQHLSNSFIHGADSASATLDNKNPSDKRKGEMTRIQVFLSLHLIYRNEATVPERVGSQALMVTWSTNREEAGSKRGENITESQQFSSLDRLDRNFSTIVPETRVGNQDKATGKTSVKNVQPIEQFINYNALTGIWSTYEEEAGSKRRTTSLEIPPLATVLDTTVRSERSHLPAPDGNNATLFDEEQNMYNLPSEDAVEVPGFPVAVQQVFAENGCPLFRFSLLWPLFRGRGTRFVRLVWDPGGEQSLIREQSST